MKKIMALILSLMLIVSFVACSDNTEDKKENISSDATDKNDETILSDALTSSDAELEEDDAAEDKNDDTQKEETKPSEDKPQSKPETSNPEASKPEAPQPKPETAPQPRPEGTAKTVGVKLLSDFNAKANSYSTAQSLANAISKNSVLNFMPVIETVSEGLLTGFGNAQITGFKDGAKFAPMIGTTPFVGYVFVLEDGASASAFISQLKSNANPNWNVCTTADETITGSAGNKVFFVMCPKSFEE